MKLFTIKKSYLLLTLFSLIVFSLNAQQIGVTGGGPFISNNSADSPAIGNFTDFGNATSRTFTIDNIEENGSPSGTVLNVTSIVLSNTTDFSLSVDPTPVSIVRNGTNPTFTIDYIGAGTGTVTSTVTVNSSNASNDGGDNAWVFTISITVAPEIDIIDSDGSAIDDGGGNSPSTINQTSFGATDTLNPISITYTIENNGAADLDITSWSSNNSNFQITSTLPVGVIAPGGTTTLQITFTPTSTGTISGIITVNSDDPDEGVYTFNVEGQGTLPPPIYTYIYHTFDESNEGWTNITSTNDSWVRTNTFTTTDEMGEGYFFRNTSYNTYLANTDIVIESPSYDFSGLNNLRLTIDVKYNTENGADGMRILYSVNGAAYQVLGASGQGTNWYEDNVIALGSDGWNNDGHSATPAFTPHSQFGKSSINLDGGIFDGQSNVRFRIQFASDGSITGEGVAFDNFYIEADPMSALSSSLTAPANLTSNLRLWLKTNEGISNNDNTPLTLWEDQATTSPLDKEDAFAASSTAPIYRDSGSRNINFNPVVDFDNSDDTSIEYMNGKGGLFSQDLFVVFRSDDTAENNTGTYTPGRQFAVGGRFSDEAYHEDATGIALGSSTARYDNEVIAFNISSFPQGSSAPNDTSYGRAYTTTTDTFSNHPLIVNVKSNSGRTASEIYKNGKRVDNTTGTAGNGADLNFNENNNLQFLLGTGRSGIAGRTTSQMNGMIAEVISYSSPNSATNQKKIQSYLSVKYGVTLQDATSTLLDHRINDTDYIDSQGDIIWDTSDTDIDGNFYNHDVAGIGRDDASNLDQRQSRSQNDEVDVVGPTSGFLTMALTDTYDTNNENISNTTGFQDREFLMWGNNNASLDAPPISIEVDMSEDIGDPMLETNVSFESMSRIWKVVENRPTVSADIGSVEVSLPVSAVRTATPPDGRYLMFISQNGRFDPTADFRVMTENGGRLYANYDFDGTEYITFGWAPERLFERSIKFDPTRFTYIDVEDNLDLDPASTDASDTDADFTISAWINRNNLSADASIISKRDFTYTSGYDFKIDTSGRLEVSWINGSMHSLNSAVEIPVGIWHHVAVIYKDGEASIYIDGILDVSQTMPAPVNTNDSFLIGAAGKGVNIEAYFDGNIDEVRVWNNALSEDQLRYIMNQELENNVGTIAKYFDDNSILPTKDEVSGIDYTKLEGYYPMSRYTYTNTKDESGRLRTGSLKQLKTVDYQTAPLPYRSTQDGDWTDSNTWVNGDKQYIPGSRALANNEAYVNWNIVETSHDIVINNATLFDDDTVNVADGDGNDNEGNRTVLAHIINSGLVTVDGDNSTETGFGYTVTHYLELGGKLDLEGESQLIQTTDSDLLIGPSGELEKDQQGTSNTYHYNYWSSPIGTALTTLDNTNTNPNRYRYTVTDVMSDNGSPIMFSSSGFDGAETPLTIADYWIWKFANNPDGDYSAWEHVRSGDDIDPGEGFTMKGPGTSNINQNYTFLGRPNNANINLTISQGNDYLVGNPYASAIDARQFILDNGPSLFFQAGTIQVQLDGSGNPVLDGNGDPIYIDNDGNLYYIRLDGSSNPVLDGNGNEIYEDSSGDPHYVQLNDAGDPVLDSNGNVVYIITGTSESDPTTSGTLYFWDHWGGGDHILANYQGGYATYNLAGSTEAPFSMTGESDIDVSQVGTGVRAPGRYIPVGQGFFVVAAEGGTINFNNGQRVFKKESTVNGETFRTTTRTNTSNATTDITDLRQKIKIGFNSVGGQHRQLLLTLDENTSPDVDWGYDGTTYDYKNDDMFWLIDNNFYVIQASNSFGEEAKYPLALYTSEDGNNSITIDQLINVDSDLDVFIHDIDLGIYHNLKDSNYNVFLNAGYYDQRFEIVFTNLSAASLGTDDEIIEDEKIDVRYSNTIDKIVLINPHGLQVNDIQIYNIIGQHITEIKEIKNGNITEYNIGKLSSGPYIIKLNTVSGSVSKKVLIN